MEDLLQDVKQGNVITIPNKHSQDVDEEQIIIEDQDLMPEFRLKIDEAQRIIERIRGNNEKILDLKRSYTSATTTIAEKGTLYLNQRDVSQKLDRIMQDNMKLNERLKNIMVDVSEDVNVATTKEPEEPETRMKIDMQNAVTIKLQSVLRESQEAQMDFKNGLKGKITRQAGYLDDKLNPQQIEEICDDPNKMQELLQKKLYGQASIQLQNAVQDIQEKYQDIQKLERSVQQVFQLFTDMALLVKNQGELIDNIEQNMIKARDYVAKGEKQLVKPKKDHQAARKKMCCIIIVGLCLVLVIVAPILGTKL